MEQTSVNHRSTCYFILILIFCGLVCLMQYDIHFNSDSLIRRFSSYTMEEPLKSERMNTFHESRNISHVDIYLKPDALSNYGDRDIFEYKDCLSRAVLLDQRVVLNSTADSMRFRCSHLMTLGDHPKGRLGNLMFKAAVVIGVSTWHSYTPVFNKHFDLFKTFDLMNSIDFTVTNTQNHEHKICCKHTKALYELDRSKNWSVSGFPHSWKYFKSAEDRVRKAFTFKTKIKAAAVSYIDSIRKINVENVCLHVRRGDYLKESVIKYGMCTASVSYIQRAMEYFRNKFKAVQFIFVSDDIKWCREKFNGPSYYFSPFNDAGTDMALLASCDHVIVTSGSFGWWGAWLAGGITVYYRGYARPGSDFESRFNTEDNSSDYYPRNWIGMV